MVGLGRPVRSAISRLPSHGVCTVKQRNTSMPRARFMANWRSDERSCGLTKPGKVIVFTWQILRTGGLMIRSPKGGVNDSDRLFRCAKSYIARVDRLGHKWCSSSLFDPDNHEPK